MKQDIITVDDLIKFMGKDKYYEFIDYLRTKHKIPQKEPIWIISEWSKENGR